MTEVTETRRFLDQHLQAIDRGGLPTAPDDRVRNRLRVRE